MLVQRTSPISGEINIKDLNITEEELGLYDSGMHIQKAFSNICSSDREFFTTGITEGEWNGINRFHRKEKSSSDTIIKYSIVCHVQQII